MLKITFLEKDDCVSSQDSRDVNQWNVQRWYFRKSMATGSLWQLWLDIDSSGGIHSAMELILAGIDSSCVKIYTWYRTLWKRKRPHVLEEKYIPATKFEAFGQWVILFHTRFPLGWCLCGVRFYIINYKRRRVVTKRLLHAKEPLHLECHRQSSIAASWTQQRPLCWVQTEGPETHT